MKIMRWMNGFCAVGTAVDDFIFLILTNLNGIKTTIAHEAYQTL